MKFFVINSSHNLTYTLTGNLTYAFLLWRQIQAYSFGWISSCLGVEEHPLFAFSLVIFLCNCNLIWNNVCTASRGIQEIKSNLRPKYCFSLFIISWIGRKFNLLHWYEGGGNHYTWCILESLISVPFPLVQTELFPKCFQI